VLQAEDGLGDIGLANPIDVVGLPVLGMECSSNGMMIYWPVGSPEFELETSTSLAPGSWTVVTNPVQIGGMWLMPDDMSETNRFYRLRYTTP